MTHRTHRLVGFWLIAICGLVIATSLIGGATRLTDSGLSITEWSPITGILPPLTAEGWEDSFAAYRAIPQYRALHEGLQLAEFKKIYLWEWAHRTAGRLVGLLFLLPWIFFAVRGVIPPRETARLGGIFGLILLQGFVGWLMVQSGLDERISVGALRLSTHFTLAMIIYAALLWSLCDWFYPERQARKGTAKIAKPISIGACVLLFIVLLQMSVGALGAGLDAGLVYNTWPLMDGAFLPDLIFALEPGWRNLIENPVSVQFIHRWTAYLLLFVLVAHLIHVRLYIARTGDRAFLLTASILGILIMAQAILGILTLVYVAPTGLALLHQAGAIGVWSIAIIHYHACLHATPPDRHLDRHLDRSGAGF